MQPAVRTRAQKRSANRRVIESIKGKDESVDNSKSLRMMRAIYATGVMDGMTAKQRKDCFESLGVNKTTRGCSRQMIESKLKAMENKYGVTPAD